MVSADARGGYTQPHPQGTGKALLSLQKKREGKAGGGAGTCVALSCTELGDKCRKHATGPCWPCTAVRRYSVPPVARHRGVRCVCPRTARDHGAPTSAGAGFGLVCSPAQRSDGSLGGRSSMRKQVRVGREYCSGRDAIKDKPTNQATLNVCAEQELQNEQMEELAQGLGRPHALPSGTNVGHLRNVTLLCPRDRHGALVPQQQNPQF